MEETVEENVSDRYFSKPMDLSMDILVNRVTDNTKEILKILSLVFFPQHVLNFCGWTTVNRRKQ